MEHGTVISLTVNHHQPAWNPSACMLQAANAGSRASTNTVLNRNTAAATPIRRGGRISGLSSQRRRASSTLINGAGQRPATRPQRNRGSGRRVQFVSCYLLHHRPAIVVSATLHRCAGAAPLAFKLCRPLPVTGRWRSSTILRACLGPCLLHKKFCKIFQISRHIESLDVCMKY